MVLMRMHEQSPLQTLAGAAGWLLVKILDEE